MQYGSPPAQNSKNLNENVSRIKAAHIGPDKNLVVFEVWSQTSYLRTMLLLVDDDAGLARLARGLGERGADEFLVLDRAGNDRELGRLPGFRCRPTGAHRGRHMPLLYDLDLWTCHADP